MDSDFKDPLNIGCILLFLLVFCIPLLPAWFGWLHVFTLHP
ncbi:MAG: hypothetical protein ACRC53_10000 [Plesiomonas sp.]